MKIIVNKTRENDTDQTIHFTITDDNENEYKWHGDIPKGINIQTHLNANMGKYLHLIRRREYPNAPVVEDMEQWIADGCIAPAILDDEENEVTPERVIAKVPFRQSHPKVMLDRAAFDLLEIEDQIDILADLLLND